jgi:hypothetical protein
VIKIPAENNKYYVSNASDLIPNIQYTKNIDMDEVGYLKMSSPFPRIISDADDNDFGVFTDAIQIKATGSEYKIATDGKIYDINLYDLSAIVDAGAPTANNPDGRFIGWKGGEWYYNSASDIYSLQATAGTVWDIENTDNISYAELFVNKNTLAGASFGAVDQYNESDMNGTTPSSTNSGITLVLPDNFRITGQAYSNYRMGIATYSETKGMAFFFTWDGATAEAGQGVPVYATEILDVVAYQNSWAILTSKGQLLRFNGAGFDVLANLPNYFLPVNWLLNSGIDHGRMMYVDGDVIYVNIGSLLEANDDGSGILKGFYSGIWCYDDAIKSIYHKHGLSTSKIVRIALTPTDNVFTSTAHKLVTGDKVLYDDGKTYYAIRLSDNTFSLASTYDLALAGTVTTDVLDGPMVWIKREDWSQLLAYNDNFGACVKFDSGENLRYQGVLPFFAGLQLINKSPSSDNSLCVMAPKFDNLSTVCYSKLKSSELEDNYRSIIVKHSKLVDGDNIVIKYKTKDNYKPIGVGDAGDSSPDNFITWATSTSFTTIDNIADVAVGDEVEFYSGAGAGSSAHIVSTTNNAGTWTVVIDEAIRGAGSGNKSTCLFDCFKKLAVITKSNQDITNQFTAPLGEVSKWIQVKLELRGRGVVIEEMIVDNVVHKPI